VPAGSQQVPAGAVPARVKDLSGLPPAFIAVGALDLFIEEDLDYASRLIAAGVPVEVHVAPGPITALTDSRRKRRRRDGSRRR
jgi:acetyl esterase/lipase